MLRTDDPATARPDGVTAAAMPANGHVDASAPAAAAPGGLLPWLRSHTRLALPTVVILFGGICFLLLPGHLLYAGSTALVAGIIGLALFLPIAALREMPLNAAGLAGLGAYLYANVASSGGVGNVLLGGLVAMAAVTGLSVVGGLASLVVTGLYFVVASLVLQIGIEKVIFSIPGVTGGAAGEAVPQPVLQGWFDSQRAIYLVVSGFALLVAVTVWWVRRSRFGRHSVLVGHVPEGASAVGVRNWAVKLMVFAISGLLIGIAGCLFSFINGTPPGTQSFIIIISVLYVAIPIASGMRDLSSVWVVAAAFTTIPIILEPLRLSPSFLAGMILLVALIVGDRREWVAGQIRRLRAPRAQDTEAVAEFHAAPVPVAAPANGSAGPSVEVIGRRDPASAGASARAATAPGGLVLEGRDITVDFGGVRAVDAVSVRLGAGERLGIVGANGAGKTTLFNALTGFVPLHAGSTRLEGRDITRWSSFHRARAGIRRTFQQPRLADMLTVEQNLLVGHGHGDSIERRERVDWLLGRFGLEPLRGMPVAALPFGVRREVELIRALGQTPKVLMLDEPVSGLEDSEAEKLLGVLLDLQAAEGWGLLVIEHDLKFITEVAERLMVMEDGRLLVEGPIHDVMRQEQVRRVYLGELVTAQ
ncbi:MAG TPA: ATP-binding cassette domain-containing protein [Candidatus Dormibacteraeota bacterium]|nr:ATP-binding cassette domain-containing protein [Candidatus Dormibacteraeota bacterium]